MLISFPCTKSVHKACICIDAIILCVKEVQNNTVILMYVSPVVLIQHVTIKLSVYT